MKKKNGEKQEPKAAPLYQNSVTLAGFLGDKPEMINNHALISLATKTSWIDKESGKWQSRTEWHRIVAWGSLAEAVKPYAKGDYVLVEGELKSSEFEREVPVIGGGTAKVPQRYWEIRARSLRKLVRKKTAKAA